MRGKELSIHKIARFQFWDADRDGRFSSRDRVAFRAGRRRYELSAEAFMGIVKGEMGIAAERELGNRTYAALGRRVGTGRGRIAKPLKRRSAKRMSLSTARSPLPSPELIAALMRVPRSLEAALRGHRLWKEHVRLRRLRQGTSRALKEGFVFRSHDIGVRAFMLKHGFELLAHPDKPGLMVAWKALPKMRGH